MSRFFAGRYRVTVYTADINSSTRIEARFKGKVAAVEFAARQSLAIGGQAFVWDLTAGTQVATYRNGEHVPSSISLDVSRGRMVEHFES